MDWLNHGPRPNNVRLLLLNIHCICFDCCKSWSSMTDSTYTFFVFIYINSKKGEKKVFVDAP